MILINDEEEKMRRIMYVAITLFLTVSAVLVFAAGEQGDGASQGEIPEIYYYVGEGDQTTAKTAGYDAVQQWILDQIGVKVHSLYSPSGEGTKVNLLLASGEPLDIFTGSWTTYRALDAIQPITDSMRKFGQDVYDAWPEDLWKAMTDADGDIWGTVRGFPRAAWPLLIRNDWLEQHNLDQPKTIDDLEKVLGVLKAEDPTGNGETIPFLSNLEGLRQGLMGAFVDGGYSNWIDPADGKVKPVEVHPNYRDWLNTMNDWYMKGWLYKEAFVFKTAQGRQAVVSNRVGASTWYFSNIIDTRPSQLRENVPNAEYVMLSITGPGGKAETLSKGGNDGRLVTKQSKYVDEAVKFINLSFKWPTDEAGYVTTRHGIEGTHWEWTDKNSYKFKLLEGAKDDYDGQFGVGVAIVNAIKGGSPSPARDWMYDFLANDFWDFDRVKLPVDWDIIYDNTKILEAVDSYNDLNRMINEETVKFISGARPLAEYDDFVKDLYKLGLDKYIDELTRQYNEATSG